MSNGNGGKLLDGPDYTAPKPTRRPPKGGFVLGCTMIEGLEMAADLKAAQLGATPPDSRFKWTLIGAQMLAVPDPNPSNVATMTATLAMLQGGAASPPQLVPAIQLFWTRSREDWDEAGAPTGEVWDDGEREPSA